MKQTEHRQLLRQESLRLNPYQRHLTHRLGRGRDHWEMVVGQIAANWADFVTNILRAAVRAHPVGNVVLPNAMERALDHPPSGDPVIAMVNHNRWIAQCECGGAEVVDPDLPNFYCFSCFNVFNEGYARTVDFPHYHAAIDKVLSLRDDPFTKNWIPGETIGELRAQNIAHGFPEKEGK